MVRTCLVRKWLGNLTVSQYLCLLTTNKSIFHRTVGDIWIYHIEPTLPIYFKYGDQKHSASMTFQVNEHLLHFDGSLRLIKCIFHLFTIFIFKYFISFNFLFTYLLIFNCVRITTTRSYMYLDFHLPRHHQYQLSLWCISFQDFF